MSGNPSCRPPRRYSGQPLHLVTDPRNTRLELTRISPGSPSVLSVPFSPASSGSPVSGGREAPRSTMPGQTYQPQQWIDTGPVGGSHMAFAAVNRRQRSTTGTTGMEANLPSPPPPYTVHSPTIPRTLEQRPEPVSLPPTPVFATRHDRDASSAGNSPHLDLDHSLDHLSRSFAYNDAGQLQASRPPMAHSRYSTALTTDDQPSLGAPASRRCHSTPAAGSNFSTPAGQASTPPQQAWLPGMPIPPPPPGPPPSSSRSASSGRLNDRMSTFPLPASRNRLLAGSITGATPLSPIPPTPAEYMNTQEGSNVHMPISARHHPTARNHDTFLSRRPARRDASADAIRDRRSKSRALRYSEDYTQPDVDAESSSPRTMANLIIPGGSRQQADRPEQSIVVTKTSAITVRTAHQPNAHPRQAAMPTPPYTPATNSAPASAQLSGSIAQTLASSTGLASARDSITSAIRTPVEEHAFMTASLDRFLAFNQRESSATSDRDQLLAFARFIVDESRIRRNHYEGAFDAVASDLYEITRDLWRKPLAATESSPVISPNLTSRHQSIDSSIPLSRGQSADPQNSSAAPSDADMTPVTDNGSFCSTLERDQTALNVSPWNDHFQPSLSPIPSMAVSTHCDDADSRGRSASRWWEASDTGSGNGAPTLERSKRETKYMSLHPSVIDQAAQALGSPKAADNGLRSISENEYPPEKVGWHDGPQAGPSGNNSIAVGKRPVYDQIPLHSGQDLSTRNVRPLDVSRLVTLPPPYPRHYPAVNNCHPQLESPRQRHREIADLEHVRVIHIAYDDEEDGVQAEIDIARAKRVRDFRTGVQHDLDRGVIDGNIAMEADRRFRAHEVERSAEAANEAYRRFQTKLYTEVHGGLQSKISEAEVCINMMTLALCSTFASGQQSTEHEQVAGDEEPELLEQLTLLKWLFEARESVHKEMFDLSIMSIRKARMVEKWSAPYRQLSRQDRETSNATFAAKCTDMQFQFATESNSRFQTLLDAVEQHVGRGVESQISAFWDIAPQISEVLTHIPQPLNDHSEDELSEAVHDQALAQLPILIPPAELADNPALHRYPAQYLYTTLSHAHDSVRQFVDAQINLLCLQHEIQTAAMAANVRMLEIQRTQALATEGRSPDLGMRTEAEREEDEEVQSDMEMARRTQEANLTADLKSKVEEVEEGWEEALGRSMRGCRGAVKGFLVRNGGWDDGLDGIDE